MKIALAQFNPTVGDFAGNSARIIELACEAKKRGADLAVFSELCLCGYPPQDLVERPAFAERNATELARLAKAIPMPSVVGYVGRAQDDTGKPVANSAALIADGKMLFEQRKMLLPTYDVFDESRYFQPAHSQHIFSLARRKTRHHDLRGLLERQEFLGAAAVRARSCDGTGGAGKQPYPEYFRFALHD